MGMALLSVMAAACTAVDPDMPENGNPGNPGIPADGSMTVVDYSVSGSGEGLTKALGDGEKNERISSLIYLLYDSGNALVKERVIPDIGRQTVWPLTRENMTWEQREALKDTLPAGNTYTAVFVANADPALFGLDGMTDANTLLHYKSPVQGVSGGYYGLEDGTSAESYQYLPLTGIFLSLPRMPFSDGNLFYIDVTDIPATAAGTSDAPYECPVVLERVVSRTEISRADSDVEYVGEGTDEAWNTFADALVRGSLYPSAKGSSGDGSLVGDDGRSGILGEIRTFMEDFAEDFGLQAAMDIFENPAYITFSTAMKKPEVAEALLAEVEGQILERYHGECMENDGLRSRMSSWKNAQVSVAFDGDVASRLFISKDAGGYVTVPEKEDGYVFDITYTADAEGVVYAAGFGDGSSFNMLDAVTVEPAGTSSAGVRIDIPSGLFFWHGPNMRNAAVCQPLETLTFAGTPSETLMTLSLDMGAFLRSGAGGMEWDSAFEAVFETVIPDGLPQGAGSYGGSLGQFTFVISIPDASVTSNLNPQASYSA